MFAFQTLTVLEYTVMYAVRALGSLPYVGKILLYSHRKSSYSQRWNKTEIEGFRTFTADYFIVSLSPTTIAINRCRI